MWKRFLVFVSLLSGHNDMVLRLLDEKKISSEITRLKREGSSPLEQLTYII